MAFLALNVILYACNNIYRPKTPDTTILIQMQSSKTSVGVESYNNIGCAHFTSVDKLLFAFFIVVVTDCTFSFVLPKTGIRRL